MGSSDFVRFFLIGDILIKFHKVLLKRKFQQYVRGRVREILKTVAMLREGSSFH